MTPPLPNPLSQQLALSQPAGPHPDEDQLAAFAESALGPRERAEILAHLASCADCRELLSLSTESAPQEAVSSKPFLVQQAARPPLKSWLPWAAIAAGVLIACTAGIAYRQKHFSADTVADSSAPSSESPQQSGAPANPANPSFSGQEPATSAAQAGTRPHWRINADGHPERAFDSQPWQPVLPDEPARMRVISVFDRDIWIGGDDSRLYHSADNGDTWKLVTLPQKGTEPHSIAHIRFRTPQSGTVEAADGTSWTTTDSGASWS